MIPASRSPSKACTYPGSRRILYSLLDGYTTVSRGTAVAEGPGIKLTGSGGGNCYFLPGVAFCPITAGETYWFEALITRKNDVNTKPRLFENGGSYFTELTPLLTEEGFILDTHTALANTSMAVALTNYTAGDSFVILSVNAFKLS